jgi:2,5-diketo-D-gluconate reductase B
MEDLPRLGLGTWQITGPECVDAVSQALEIGYRHIDTARAYENELEVGRGLAESGVPRDEIFVTTKVPHTRLKPDQVRESAESSLRDLGLDRVDLILAHWPNPDVPLQDTLEAFVRLQEEGLTQLIGVSNFPPGLFAQALELAPIATNQVEYHPFLGQDRLLELAEEHDAFITAYSPLAHGKVADDALLQEIGASHGKSAGQVALRWLLDQPRVVAVPKAASTARRAENLDVFDFELTPEERARIAALPKDRREIDPPWAPDWNA